ALSPDASTLAVSVGKDGICLFDAATGKDRGWHKLNSGCGHLAFTADGKTLAWAGEKTLEVHDLGRFLAGCGPRPAWPLSDPPDVLLRAELVTLQDPYVLDRGGVTSEAFHRTFASPAPTGPRVDLAFRIRNTGTQPITIPPDLKPE